MAKPEVTGEKREPLPEGEYPFTVVDVTERVLPSWKHKFAILNWNENEEKRASKEEEYEARLIGDFEELPFHKQREWHIELKVRDGEHQGAWLPPVDLPFRWNPDKKWREKSNWFRFCKVLVPDCASRADEGDLPDLHKELIGTGGIVDVEITDKGYNKNAGFRKDPEAFGKRVTVTSGKQVDESGEDLSDEEIPF